MKKCWGYLLSNGRIEIRRCCENMNFEREKEDMLSCNHIEYVFKPMEFHQDISDEEIKRFFQIQKIKDSFPRKVLLDTLNKISSLEERQHLKNDITHQIKSFMKRKKIVSYERFMQQWYVGISYYSSLKQYICIFDKKPKNSLFQTELFYFCGLSEEHIKTKFKTTIEILEKKYDRN